MRPNFSVRKPYIYEINDFFISCLKIQHDLPDSFVAHTEISIRFPFTLDGSGIHTIRMVILKSQNDKYLTEGEEGEQDYIIR